MNIFSKVVLCVCLSVAIGACSRSVTPTKNTNVGIGNYEEDLSDVRVTYSPKPVAIVPAEKVPIKEKTGGAIVQIPQQVNAQVDIALDSIAIKNKNVRYSSGYRIQVYVGNDRREVDEAKTFVYQNFPELSTYLTFSQPTYKLKAGDFTSRLDAERYYSTIKQRYSMAMMISERIDIKKVCRQDKR